MSNKNKNKNKNKEINTDDLDAVLDQAERLAARQAREVPSAAAGKVITKVQAAKYWRGQAPQKPATATTAGEGDTKTKD